MSQAEDFPSVELLIPHSGELVLLNRVLQADDDSLVAAITVRADGLYNHGDHVPAWVALEYMAQAVAAFAGWHAWRAGEPVRLGFLLGSRRFTCSQPGFMVGTDLTVSVRRLLDDESGMAVFECQAQGADHICAEARLNVFQPPDTERYLREHHE